MGSIVTFIFLFFPLLFSASPLAFAMGRIRGLGRGVLMWSACGALSTLVVTFRRGLVLLRDSRCGLRACDMLLRLNIGVLGIVGP